MYVQIEPVNLYSRFPIPDSRFSLRGEALEPKIVSYIVAFTIEMAIKVYLSLRRKCISIGVGRPSSAIGSGEKDGQRSLTILKIATYLLRVKGGLQRYADRVREVGNADDDEGEPLPLGELAHCTASSRAFPAVPRLP
jgi:hypothetical protein